MNKKSKNSKISISDDSVMLQKAVTALEDCMKWMESLRASGDAGNWEWEIGDEYCKAQEVLNELKTK